MQIKYYAWFETKSEKTELLQLIRESRSDIEAINKILQKYPNVKLNEVKGIVENFKKEINKK